MEDKEKGQYFLNITIIEPSFDKSYKCSISIDPSVYENCEKEVYLKMKLEIDFLINCIKTYYKEQLESFFFLDSEMMKEHVAAEFEEYLNGLLNDELMMMEDIYRLSDKTDLRAALKKTKNKIESRFEVYKNCILSEINCDARQETFSTINSIVDVMLGFKKDVDDRMDMYSSSINYFRFHSNVNCLIYIIDPHKHDYDIEFDNKDEAFVRISKFLYSEAYSYIKKEITEKFLRYSSDLRAEIFKLNTSISTKTGLSFLKEVDILRVKYQTMLESKDLVQTFVDEEFKNEYRRMEIFEDKIIARVKKGVEMNAIIFKNFHKGNYTEKEYDFAILNDYLMRPTLKLLEVKDDMFVLFWKDCVRQVFNTLSIAPEGSTGLMFKTIVAPVKLGNIICPEYVLTAWHNIKVNKLLKQFEGSKIDDDCEILLTGKFQKDGKSLYKEAYAWHMSAVNNKKEGYKKAGLQRLSHMEYSPEKNLSNGKHKCSVRLQITFVVERCLLNNVNLTFKSTAEIL